MNRLWRGYLQPLLLAAVVWFLAVHDLPVVAMVIILVIEWPHYRGRPTMAQLLEVIPEMVLGLSTALTISLLPRAASQLMVAILYGLWRIVIARPELRQRLSWPITAVSQIAAFEALFLWAAAALSHPPRIIVLIGLFIASFSLVYARLQGQGERAAAVLAASWAVVTVEAAWVFLAWSVSYVIVGGYLVVPQATIILTGLGYCAGSIYLAGKKGELSRARLSEYLVIIFVLVVVVVAGTPWRGTI